MDVYKTSIHTPPHLYRPGAKYFITASLYGHMRLLDNRSKQHLLLSLSKGCRNHGWLLDDWVFLDDHYHIMVTAPETQADVSALVAEYHRFTALFIKKNNADAKALPRIFQNYWDTCITYEKSYYARLNYLYYNPVKHGYVSDPEKYPWGSYCYRMRTERDHLARICQEYPFDRIQVQEPE